MGRTFLLDRYGFASHQIGGPPLLSVFEPASLVSNSVLNVVRSASRLNMPMPREVMDGVGKRSLAPSEIFNSYQNIGLPVPIHLSEKV